MNNRPTDFARPTIRQVADAAGVSVGTVSRVLNGHSSVRPQTRRRVQEAIRELGYAPDSVAQSMRNRRTRTIGCILRDISIPTLAAFAKSVQDELQAANYTLIVANSNADKALELELLGLFARRRADGLILSLSSERDAELLTAIETCRLPVVLLEREHPASADAVTVNHAAGMQQAVEQLIDLGHRRIALITGPGVVQPAEQRIEGYRRAHAARGLTIDPRLVREGSFSAEFGLQETSALLSAPEPPTAIVSGGIGMLPGVLRAVRTHECRVPEELSLVACGDGDLAQFVTPAISVLHWDWGMVGRFIARTLLERLGGSATAERRTLRLSTEFIVRGSCGPPSATPQS